MRKYPLLEFDLEKLLHNAQIITNLCQSYGIEVAGIVKGFNAIPAGAFTIARGGCKQIGSSRIEHLKVLKDLGLRVPTMLVRIPMLDEAEDVIEYADISLNSNIATLRVLDATAKRLNKMHKVILMYDLGDLREGFFYRKDIADTACYVERDLENLELVGIGTNLGCYGSTKPTRENLFELAETAELIETQINRKLDYISGGGSTTLPALLQGEVPKKINHLRIGEAICNTQDLPRYFGVTIDGMDKDTFVLKAQIVELYNKPTYPIGELCVDAFGRKPIYIDRGIRLRAIVALGNQDTWDCSRLVPKDERIIVVGASSDHTILDIQDCDKAYKVGDVIEFNVLYQSMLFTTMSPTVNVKIIQA